MADISDEQVSWTATFDYVTNCTDRADHQSNWLAVRCERTNSVQIKLLDNGFSFDYRGGESLFVTKMRGKPLPEIMLQGVDRLQKNANSSALANLLSAQQLVNLDTRCGQLLASSCIPATN